MRHFEGAVETEAIDEMQFPLLPCCRHVSYRRAALALAAHSPFRKLEGAILVSFIPHLPGNLCRSDSIPGNVLLNVLEVGKPGKPLIVTIY